MPFHSILFDGLVRHTDVDKAEEPAFFADLNLDQVLESMTAGREEYRLKPFFYTPLHEVAAVRYRHEVLRDLEKSEVLESVRAFAHQMQRMRAHLAQAERLRYRHQQERWFLDAVEIYGGAVRSLADELARLGPESQGLQAFRQYLVDYTAFDDFTSLAAETQALRESLAAVRYAVHIKESRVTVSKYGEEADYSAEVEETFVKFKQGAVKDYHAKLTDMAEMNHVEARILELVARLFPDVFGALDEFCARHSDYLDATIVAFDREIQFFIACLEYMERFKPAGLRFCYPQVSVRSKEVYADDAFDLALASKLVPERSEVVCNNFFLKGAERILVVSGPNQGGKTTFARMVGQLHYLASLGLPVPGSRAQLFLFDRLFTHFEKEEDIATLRGKLDDELVRIRDILRAATSQSVIIMNEMFTATTLKDALFLGTEVMGQIVELGSLGVCVTFLDELASLGESTVSMVSTVVPENPAQRTFKIVRRPADGLAYAWALAKKYGLTYERLKERIPS
jgi:DNA mismatch repair ATPase MutS